jgi:transposase
VMAAVALAMFCAFNIAASSGVARAGMTGEDRRRKWRRVEREQILAAAFAPGAVVAQVARQFDVASSLVYTWRRQTAGVAARKRTNFAPAILIEQAQILEPAAPPLLPPVSLAAPVVVEPVAITVEFPTGVRVVIDATASAALVTAALRALQ